MYCSHHCNFLNCKNYAIDNERYCVEHREQCQYCGSTKTANISLNSSTTCDSSSCLNAAHNYRPFKYPASKNTSKFMRWLGKKLNWQGYRKTITIDNSFWHF